MFYIDHKSKDGESFRLYYGNSSTYKEALKLYNMANGSKSYLHALQLADCAVNRSENKIIKSRKLVTEILDKYYENTIIENNIIQE